MEVSKGKSQSNGIGRDWRLAAKMRRKNKNRILAEMTAIR
ncbi:hypothetical protein ACFDR9_004872 [Janthinobacterium sp. CG_23.3]|nr:hypothetical protein [Janthinobacterium sp. CG_S6]